MCLFECLSTFVFNQVTWRLLISIFINTVNIVVHKCFIAVIDTLIWCNSKKRFPDSTLLTCCSSADFGFLKQTVAWWACPGFERKHYYEWVRRVWGRESISPAMNDVQSWECWMNAINHTVQSNRNLVRQFWLLTYKLVFFSPRCMVAIILNPFLIVCCVHCMIALALWRYDSCQCVHCPERQMLLFLVRSCRFSPSRKLIFILVFRLLR